MKHTKTNSKEIRNKFKGVWPALITPIGPDGEPEFTQLEKLTDIIISQKMDGIYLLGSTGQGILLTEAQRKKVAEVVLSMNDDRLPVMVQVGAMTTAESIRLAQHAAQHGASGISSVGPIYYGGGSQTMALTHYRSIAQASDLPFFPYQLGEVSFNGGVTKFIDAVLDIPNVGGMKLTTTNLLQISEFSANSRGALILFSGADELMCHAAMCGTSGAIGSMYNLWGPECQRVRKAFLRGDVTLGTDFMMIFQEVIIRILPNFWTFLRQAMQFRYGIDVGMALPPLGNNNELWTEQEVQSLVERVIEAANAKITA
ncbi:MAG: dihydrodipicolinate synthase family protein [Saprospiraceae bacterium]|nr:dihydrodipicolinate synthase family protein [Saprospiraceae bacterium]